MPQDRSVLHSDDTLVVERVVSHAPANCWSPAYEVATPRLVLPTAGITEFRLGGEAPVALDSVTVLSLPVGLPYRMNPAPCAARESVVVSSRPGATDLPLQAQLWTLSMTAIWQMRKHWRLLKREGESAATGHATVKLLQAALAPKIARPVPGGRSVAAVLRAQRFMALHMASPDAHSWTLRDASDAAGCSLFHLARNFRGHTGVSLNGYRQRLRLARALQYLEAGERDLAGLAATLGYSSQSHMGSIFQAALGITPAQARSELSA